MTRLPTLSSFSLSVAHRTSLFRCVYSSAYMRAIKVTASVFGNFSRDQKICKFQQLENRKGRLIFGKNFLEGGITWSMWPWFYLHHLTQDIYITGRNKALWKFLLRFWKEVAILVVKCWSYTGRWSCRSDNTKLYMKFRRIQFRLNTAKITNYIKQLIK